MENSFKLKVFYKNLKLARNIKFGKKIKFVCRILSHQKLLNDPLN